jgi:hypothetical protein
MSVMETLVATAPPMARDKDNVFRIAGTRVRLETVLTAFQLEVPLKQSPINTRCYTSLISTQ